MLRPAAEPNATMPSEQMRSPPRSNCQLLGTIAAIDEHAGSCAGWAPGLVNLAGVVADGPEKMGVGEGIGGVPDL